MGLAAPKKRMKISHDPNNTKWTNDTLSFGQKIMRSHGWQPGDYLGAKDAAHAEFHTEANASHIRVAIKDDNLGLGAKIGSGVGHGECTGLDAFQNLLGRLNGRDEDEMEKEQKSREDLKRAIYTEQRWGSIRFVKGGMLIGDKIQPLIEAEAERIRNLAKVEVESSSGGSSDSEEATSAVQLKKSKKRKFAADGQDGPEIVAVKPTKPKKKRKVETILVDEKETVVSLKVVELSKKKSKKIKSAKSESEESQDEPRSSEQKKTKEERRREKEKKKAKSKVTEVEVETPDQSVGSKEARKKAKRDRRKAALEEQSASSTVTTKENTPLPVESSGRSTPIAQGRHAVRARNIAQKRLASMDVASLNQIFMIKS